MAKWQLQEAKAKFSKVVEDAVEKGPQIVTKRGVETAVVISFDEWKRSQSGGRPSLKDVLLGPGPRFEIPLPKRGKGKWREPVVFE
jgi:prevent-host-death family protein